MCHFITAVLSPGADVEAAFQIAKAHGRRWDPIDNASINTALRAGESYYYTSHGCDCGCGFGVLARSSSHPPDYESKLEDFRKKGWSSAKIERWLNEKRKSEAWRTDFLASPPDDVILWHKFVHEVIDAGAARYVGLLVHWYSGGLETETIPIQTRRWTTIADLNCEHLLRAEEDVLHLFGKPRSGEK